MGRSRAGGQTAWVSQNHIPSLLTIDAFGLTEPSIAVAAELEIEDLDVPDAPDEIEDPAAPAAKRPKRTKTHVPREDLRGTGLVPKLVQVHEEPSPVFHVTLSGHCQALVPEIFDGLRKDSISRWKEVGAASTAGSSGRKKLASEEQGMVMPATVFDLIKSTSGAAVSTELVASLWQEKFHINPSTSWVRSFLHNLGLSFKTATRTTKPPSSCSAWGSTTSTTQKFTTSTKLPATSFLHSPRSGISLGNMRKLLGRGTSNSSHARWFVSPRVVTS
eukprot:5553443-Amphidinium_carterae.1